MKELEGNASDSHPEGCMMGEVSESGRSSRCFARDARHVSCHPAWAGGCCVPSMSKYVASYCIGFFAGYMTRGLHDGRVFPPS